MAFAYKRYIMQEQVAIQNLLRRKFTEAQSKNPSYSIRAFAVKLRMNSGPLSAILSGKRFISKTVAEKIAERLYLDPQERAELLKLFPEKRRYLKAATKGTDSIDIAYLALTAAQFRVISEWQHLAILSLMNTEDFKSMPEWIASRLGISLTQALQSIERLINIDMIERKEDGTLVRTTPRVRTSDDIADLSIKKSHEETLDIARQKLHDIDVKERDFSHITLAINPALLPRAKALIREFQDKLAELLETGPKSEVYRFSTQLFPFTNVLKKEETNVPK